MPHALVDTTVLFAAAHRTDQYHDDAVPILQGVDDGSLPEAVVLDFVLVETLNGLHRHEGPGEAVDFLDRIEGNGRFQIASLNSDEVATAKSVFRRHDPFSFVDSCLISYMKSNDIDYLYAFDDDFDAATDVYRLETAIDPFDPT